ncbi:hypothetical protein [Streptomyces omiyaensis]|uniref:Integral membrane protein n=1 Tax=Streptomyces omiyaensis TaxID=68247 RepID=A0ABW7BM35_9ACTN|nr:hypothetical protein [Streptomyces omiyaensis]GGY26949.1 hypothetical protein GCM10010363_04500 [Streptomyces omiyaensis]
MSFGDPNNPYGQQQGQQPGYGYPQAPQGVPQQGGYGYPAAPPVSPYGAYPGGPGQIPQSMPGLLMTARVFLYLISAVQIIAGLGYIYVASIASDASEIASDYGSDNPFEDLGNAAAGISIVLALVFLGLAALSITLGVKFGRGGQGVRITTVVYGALGTIVGAIGLFIGLDSGLATAVIFPLIWVVFGVIITLAPVVPSGTAWFSRPRY